MARAHFKVPDTGSFAFRIGPASGTIDAINYTAAQYREIGACEAAEMIANVHSFILDVRTPPEYASGHIEGAVPIPVQQMQRRLDELAAHKQDPVFVYCASGNRSTVAGKLLVDAGFDRFVNSGHGIKEWYREGLPKVKWPLLTSALPTAPPAPAPGTPAGRCGSGSSPASSSASRSPVGSGACSPPPAAPGDGSQPIAPCLGTPSGLPGRRLPPDAS